MTTPLDPAQDPDRYDPAKDTPPNGVGTPPGPLDWALDPDRYDPTADKAAAQASPRQPLVLGRTGGTRQTLPDLLAEGSYDDKTSPYIWILGLVGTAAFLLLVAFIFSHLSP